MLKMSGVTNFPPLFFANLKKAKPGNEATIGTQPSGLYREVVSAGYRWSLMQVSLYQQGMHVCITCMGTN